LLAATPFVVVVLSIVFLNPIPLIVTLPLSSETTPTSFSPFRTIFESRVEPPFFFSPATAPFVLVVVVPLVVPDAEATVPAT